MTIEQLEHIACVARTGSISRAAAELHMSQPALSRSIRRLEDELGDRVAVPLSDASAHATFYLVYRTNERGQGPELIERMLPHL